MKPADFDVRARQLFGFLIPGILWLSALALVFLESPVAAMLDFAGGATLISTMAFLTTAFLVGVLSQNLSYRHAKWWERRQWVRRRITESSYDIDLARNVDSVLSKLGEDPGFIPWKNADPDPYRQSRDRFYKTKWYLLVRAPHLSGRLLDAESEINIVGMNMLPGVALQLALITRVGELQTLPLWLPHPFLLGILLVATATIWTGLLAITFAEARHQERRLAFQIFLMATGALKSAPANREE